VASLFHLLVSGFGPKNHWIDPESLTALAVLPIVAAVAFAVRRIRRSHQESDRGRRI